MEQTNFARGELFGDRYIIQGKIGRGGMGSVFLALDKKTGRQVALKTLHKRYADNRSAIARFIREIATVRQLNHPGIVKILDAQKLDDMFFYTMEYVEGKSLRSLLQLRQKLEFPSVVRILCLVADALSHAHTITIHRDLSPENIMVVRDGTIRLLDFGLAKLEDGFKDLTVTGVDLGKVQYMAPEQQVNAGKVDCRADLYPLGVMFFELLTGRAPQEGRKLTELRPDLPPEADVFLEKAMARDPDQRFQSAVAFRDALFALYRDTLQ